MNETVPNPSRVFISYRRQDGAWAVLIEERLRKRGYDTFIDSQSLGSGDFASVILENIRAREHFLLLLAPHALDRCSEPDDWLRREVEAAIDAKRNLVPVMLGGFSFDAPEVEARLVGKLRRLKQYNACELPLNFLDSAIDRLCRQFLSVAPESVRHPVSAEVAEITKLNQNATASIEASNDWLEIVRRAGADASTTRSSIRSGRAGSLRPAGRQGVDTAPWQLGWLDTAAKLARLRPVNPADNGRSLELGDFHVLNLDGTLVAVAVESTPTQSARDRELAYPSPIGKGFVEFHAERWRSRFALLAKGGWERLEVAPAMPLLPGILAAEEQPAFFVVWRKVWRVPHDYGQIASSIHAAQSLVGQRDPAATWQRSPDSGLAQFKVQPSWGLKPFPESNHTIAYEDLAPTS